MTQDTMKDWPAKLRLNAAACMLAPVLYHAWLEAYGLHGADFEGLHYEQRQGWIITAAEWLKSTAPEPPKKVNYATLLRPTHGQVIGAIGVKP